MKKIFMPKGGLLQPVGARAKDANTGFLKCFDQAFSGACDYPPPKHPRADEANPKGKGRQGQLLSAPLVAWDAAVSTVVGGHHRRGPRTVSITMPVRISTRRKA